MAAPLQPHHVHPKIWQACAGPAVAIPKLHSKVYYFPLGHAEIAGLSPSDYDFSAVSPSILCTISDVNLLSDPNTDECFAKLLLTPLIDYHGNVQETGAQEDGNNVDSFVKILSQSDCNGSTFVPVSCVNLILPPLDVEDPNASQKLSVSDLHGKIWKINHTLSAKKHLFTSGWGHFVNSKKLVAGDSVVYIKDWANNLFFGIRRKRKRNVMDNKVLQALELARNNKAFEVSYYPKPNWTDFVVDANTVDEAMKIGWKRGMRVKLLTKEESSKKQFLQPEGTVANVVNWRMLKVNWDKPDIANYINPWQLEVKQDVSGGMQGARQSKELIGNSSRTFKLFGKVISLDESDKDARYGWEEK